MVHACNLSIQEAETEGSQVSDQPGLHSETLSQKQKQQYKKSHRLTYYFPKLLCLAVLMDF
jgi:hypothetical protein